MEDQTRILALAVDAGEVLLHSGGEIARVQETMERIARAYGAENFHAYVLTNGIFASVDDHGRTLNSEIRHVRETQVHLGRVTALNALSREIEAGGVPLADAFRRLDEIQKIPYLADKRRIFACGVGAACFCYLFGGTVLDAGITFFIGALLQTFCLLMANYKTISKIIRIILEAGMVALVSFGFSGLFGVFGITANLDKMIIGGIIPLVPGMALTTAIRDFAGGDYLSGTIRLIDALLIGSSIAIGVGMVLMLAAMIPGVFA